jgi:hypothetical protein
MGATQSQQIAILLATRLLSKSTEELREYINVTYPNVHDYRIDTSQVYAVEVD